MRTLVLGTRGSPLALCQAQLVQAKLEARVSDCSWRREIITARADTHPELPLTALGSEGVFVKELETALLERRIDLAVHSMKDLPLDLAPRLCIAAVLERDEPRDALVARSGQSLGTLPAGTRVGTSSLRRRSQLLRRRPDLVMLEIRGNVDTRLRKLDEGRYDAIVVAACGLMRLDLAQRITVYVDMADMLPEPGQGALAVEARADDAETLNAVRVLDHAESRACVDAERSFLRALEGGCRVPIAAYASVRQGIITLQGAVIATDGTSALRAQLDGPARNPVALGTHLAEQLTAQGARALLKIAG